MLTGKPWDRQSLTGQFKVEADLSTLDSDQCRNVGQRLEDLVARWTPAENVGQPHLGQSTLTIDPSDAVATLNNGEPVNLTLTIDADGTASGSQFNTETVYGLVAGVLPEHLTEAYRVRD